MKQLFILLICFNLSAVAQDSISKSTVQQASQLMDVKFTEKEIEMMLQDLKDNLFDYKKMHALLLNNNIAMSAAQRLQPDNAIQQKINWQYNKKIQLPSNKNELAFYSILQLGSLLRNKLISSKELTAFFIERIKKYGDTLECVVSITQDIAMQQAAQADDDFKKGIDRGPLQGIPYGLKDLFAVKGTKTTWGAAPYKEQVIEEDAYVYTRLKEAGAVLIAKFTLGALAMGDYWFGGRTKNPWNLERGSSGSSAGSASATVAGLVPFAIGTETHGSIISPSHTCGATGLRPTFGSISRSGAMTLSWSLDKVGPICRSAEDAATVFSFVHGTDQKDGSAVNAAFNYNPTMDVKKLKIAYAKNIFDKLDTAAQEWNVLKQLTAAGIALHPMNFPDTETYQFDMIGIVIGSEAAAAFDAFTRLDMDEQMTRQTRNDWPNYFRQARTIPAVEYINTMRHRSVLMEKTNQAMKEFDVVISPSFGGRQLAITNLTGHPALCMPIGLSKQGTPNSITFLANLFKEEALLSVGKFFQSITSFDEMHPEKFK
ncbi:MAG: amidase [Bacteroidota bacterium]|jgi:Asp-tRNA(Asn)/Glu-tRNA(Gln) amidotransferase A subunit family amidase